MAIDVLCFTRSSRQWLS